MASDVCTKRLRKEYRDLQRNPVPNIRACPLENNILEWHYVIEGAKGSPYQNGWYHGKVIFPSNYPYKPPAIQMITPSGRFKPNTRLCLSMSDFHPETWNPMWSVSTILMGLQSFMLEDSPTYGSISTSTMEKRKLAAESLEFNSKNKIFGELFPELVELNLKLLQQRPPKIESSTKAMKENDAQLSCAMIFVIIAIIISSSWAVIAVSLN
jgi:ubiquitin-conjugating enzyme E2 J2